VSGRAQAFVDLWPEQAFRILVEGAGIGLHADVTVCEPGTRLVFTWREPDWPEGVSTDVNVLFEPLFGGTLLTVEHSGFERLDGTARQGAAKLIALSSPVTTIGRCLGRTP
jgi:uncharacterized protein YndB with AHSA1/START domain